MTQKIVLEFHFKNEGGEGLPSTANVHRFRPDPEKVEVVRRYLTSAGLPAHDNGFGLTVSAAADRIKAVLGIDILGVPCSFAVTETNLPSEIAAPLSEICAPKPPTFF